MSQMKRQFLIAPAAKIGSDIANIELLGGTTLQAVENRFHGRQTMPSAKRLLDQDFNELVLNELPSPPLMEEFSAILKRLSAE